MACKNNKLKITITLDGTGTFFNRAEPIHLDALLSRELIGVHSTKHNIGRNDKPDFIPLPLQMDSVSGHKIWRASAFFIDDEMPETLRYWRKKVRTSRFGVTTGSPNLQNGVYREYNMPMPLLLARTATSYAIGNRKRVAQLLRRLKYFGAKSSYGHGRIVNIDVSWVDYDWSWVNDKSEAMRWLPDDNGFREVRTQPPYWNVTNTCLCCEVGDAYNYA